MKNSIAVATLCALPFAVGAQTERDLDSHDHGAGSLNVAIENNSVYLELSTPWENLVGFEHAPSTDEQKSLVAAALDTLNDPSQLFSFVGSDCSVQSAEIENRGPTFFAADASRYSGCDGEGRCRVGRSGRSRLFWRRIIQGPCGRTRPDPDRSGCTGCRPGP